MSNSYINYAINVISNRALPDIIDGLKPVHRRILYTMYKIKNNYKNNFIKCARIVGEVMGKYHPHGDNSIYDALVRMAQNFSLKYTLIKGQGNFGSIDGDNAAAMRYTECKLNKISNEFFHDINKNTVKFINNYDNKEKEPLVLPCRIPNLLINGSYGIAVGMSTNIPPHNFTDSINTAIYLLLFSECKIKDLIKILKAPDFPTGGNIIKISKLHNAYYYGKGSVTINSKFIFEKINKKTNIIITEIPYQINKKKILEQIIKLIKNKKINFINNLKDESNKLGIRIVIELKKNLNKNKILKILFKKTSLQHTININIIALIKNIPKKLNLKKILIYFIKYRKKLIIKKLKFILKKLKKKKYLLEGFVVVINNINKFIKIVKKSKNNIEAIKNITSNNWKLFIKLKIINFNKKNKKYIKNIKKKIKIPYTKKYKISVIQSKLVLKLRLNKIIKLESYKIFKKYKLIIIKILIYFIILKKKNKIYDVIFEELNYIKYNTKIKNKDIRLTNINKK
ncbi:DNA gyrase A subunit [Candidatus Zinderia insecticola CARI]|uniref:DNA gyrase A subunit n=1 Tax=Zinderia insecticola (strain CARI) TaxID=871271 RepID=E0TJ54_ZINIC|nr:DNA gyrase A subunit [Candidatus Zinderia insecticola CARI]